jgi:hypothetical protein
MVVASVLMSMGMMMLPPVVVSLPFKLIFFVLVDGWHAGRGQSDTKLRDLKRCLLVTPEGLSSYGVHSRTSSRSGFLEGTVRQR